MEQDSYNQLTKSAQQQKSSKFFKMPTMFKGKMNDKSNTTTDGGSKNDISKGQIEDNWKSIV